MEINNLDALINKISFEIVNQKIVDENQINKMLGVLANDGVYALWVFSNDKLKFNSIRFWSQIFNKPEVDKLFGDINLQEVREITNNSLSKIENESKDKKENQFFVDWQKEVSTKCFHKLSENLSDLLFFRDILEKILIYARYHAKAMGEKNE